MTIHFEGTMEEFRELFGLSQAKVLPKEEKVSESKPDTKDEILESQVELDRLLNMALKSRDGKKRITLEETHFILYANSIGMRNSEMAELLGRSNAAIHRALADHGIRKNKIRSDIGVTTKPKTIYSDQEAFQNQ